MRRKRSTFFSVEAKVQMLGLLRMPYVRRARRIVALAVWVLCFGITACSLLIPFEDYRSAGSPDAAADGEGDAKSEVDAAHRDAGEDASCETLNLASDPHNCGSCGRACAERGSCNAGRCPVEVVFDEAGAGVVQSLVVRPMPDGGTRYLYFTTGEPFVARRPTLGGAIERTRTTGGATKMSISFGGAVGVAIVGENELHAFDPNNFTAPLQPIRTSPVALGPLLVPTAGQVFWGDHEGAWWSAPTASAVPRGGPDAGTAVPVAFAQENANVVWVTRDGAVYSTPTVGPGVVTRLFPGGSGATFTTLDASKTYLYLAQRSPLGGGVAVYAVANFSAPPKTLAVTDPRVVVADGSYVYILDYGSSDPPNAQLLRANGDGSNRIVLADRLRPAYGLAFDGPWVYFADGPRILRTSK